jgi:hypothetical protein
LSVSPRQVWSWHLVVLEPSCGGWWPGTVVGQRPVCGRPVARRGGGLAGLQAGRCAVAWRESRAGAWRGGVLVRLQPGTLAGRLLPTCSFSVLWHGEAFHGLGAKGAEVLALTVDLPQPSMSPVSQQGPWFRELTQSASVSQSPFWIPSIVYSLKHDLFSYTFLCILK